MSYVDRWISKTWGEGPLSAWAPIIYIATSSLLSTNSARVKELVKLEVESVESSLVHNMIWVCVEPLWKNRNIIFPH